jgi:hypothetical protein
VPSIPLKTAAGVVIGVIPARAIHPDTGEVGIWATLRDTAYGPVSLIMSVPVRDLLAQASDPGTRASAATIRRWLLRRAREEVLAAHPEFAHLPLDEGEVSWYIWDSGRHEPLLR